MYSSILMWTPSRPAHHNAIVICVVLAQWLAMSCALLSSSDNLFGVEVRMAQDLSARLGEQRVERLQQLILKSLHSNDRLLVLICKLRCYRSQTQIPRWIREYMKQQQLQKAEQVRFSYQFYENRYDTQLFDNQSMINEVEPHIIYVVGGMIFQFTGSIKNKDDFMAFLSAHEANTVGIINDCFQLENIINAAQACGDLKTVIQISDNTSTAVEHLNAITYTLHLSNYALYRLNLPMLFELQIELFSRLEQLPSDLPLIVLLQNNGYYWLSTNVYTEQLISAIDAAKNSNCSDHSVGWYQISGALSEVERDYRRELNESSTADSNQSYILVGATGGIAVVALAISIFWGLNGSTFAK